MQEENTVEVARMNYNSYAEGTNPPCQNIHLESVNFSESNKMQTAQISYSIMRNILLVLHKNFI